METAKLIKEYREKNKLTQKQLSEMICYNNPQFLSLIENERNKLPLYMAKTFCEALKIEPQAMEKALVDDYRKRVKQYMRGL